MEKAVKSNSISLAKAYVLLTKPGIIFGNSVTAIGGFLLASKGVFNFPLFLAMFEGLGLVIASACVFNNTIDKDLDQKMQRTRNRPLVRGEITSKSAIVFGTSLAVIGFYVLAVATNLLTAGVALFGFIIYVFAYSYSKYYTTHCTLIGSIAGAVPPVVGYTAVTGYLDAGAIILFVMIAMWQMPHFYAIAIYRLADYKKASIPVYPLVKGMRRTKIDMVLYTIGFIVSAVALTRFQYTGYLYLTVALALGFSWLILCIKGFRAENDTKWARKVFIFSLVVVMGISFVIPFSVL